MNKIQSVFCLIILIAGSCLIPKKRVKETHATYIESELNIGPGMANWWQFTSAGKTYLIRSWKPPFKIPGDKYIVIFDSLHPKTRNFVDDTRRIFIPGEETQRAKGTILYDRCRYPRKKNKMIEYEYYLNGIRYERGQHLLKGQDTICFRSGDTIEVEYWVPNPLRSIAHLDTLIKRKLMQLKK